MLGEKDIRVVNLLPDMLRIALPCSLGYYLNPQSRMAKKIRKEPQSRIKKSQGAQPQSQVEQMKFGPMLAALAAALLAIITVAAEGDLEDEADRQRRLAPRATIQEEPRKPSSWWNNELEVGKAPQSRHTLFFGNWGQEMVAQLNEPSMRDVVQELQDPPNPAVADL